MRKVTCLLVGAAIAVVAGGRAHAQSQSNTVTVTTGTTVTQICDGNVTVFVENKPAGVVVEDDGDGDVQVFVSVDQMPQFPGGEKALLQWISSHLEYPQNAYEAEIQGRVIVKFVIDKTGKVVNPTVFKSVHPLLDEAALNVVNSLPDFEPGLRAGEPVNVWYYLPVSFKLQPKGEEDVTVNDDTKNSEKKAQTVRKTVTSTSLEIEGVNGAVFIVDDKEITQEQLNNIDPNTIATMTVVTDRPDLYPRGAIIITTKR